jgi:hypothetical protein
VIGRKGNDDDDPLDRWMFWFNLVGISVVLVLLTTFTVLYGSDFLSFIIGGLRPDALPDR